MLNNKQKQFLKSLGNPLRPLFQLGKEGLSFNFIESLKDSLKAHELVKISVLKSCDVSVNELSIDIVAQAKCDLVQVIGKTILVYKPSEKHLIELPK
jgi:RNA-binding protein